MWWWVGWLGDLLVGTSNNTLLSVGRHTDCLSFRKIYTFETYPWWNLVPQLTCFVKQFVVETLYHGSEKRLH